MSNKAKTPKRWSFRKKDLSPSSDLNEKKHSVEEETTIDLSSKSKEPEIPPISFVQLFRFSTRFEIFLDVIGLIAAAAAGASQPAMSILFGGLTEQFINFSTAVAQAHAGGPDVDIPAAIAEAGRSFRKEASLSASYLVYLGIGMFACIYIYMYTWIYTGEVNAKRIRERYLRAVLRQDIAYFDNVGAGEVATRIQTDTHLIQQGISEKVALVVNFLGAFICGFVIGFVRSWRLTLAMSSILPCLAVAGMFMERFVSAYMRLSLNHIADGGTLAEEVISSIRTAQAFGTQKTLSKRYNTHIDQSLTVNLKSAVIEAMGFAFFFFIIYAAYALAFYFGTTLITSGHSSPGDIISVISAVVIGSFSLAIVTPEMQGITQALGAAAKIYQTIDRVPVIDSASEAGLKPEQVAGEISLEGVNFSYPSRPTVPVVKDLTLSFRAGKIAALVGASGSGKSTIVSLAERFYDPLSGVVKLDGVDIKDLNLKWLRSQIGLVSQEPTLFAGSIRDNVAHGLINTPHENAPDEEKFKLIREACIKANASGFISDLPDGYDTLVGERGFLLSGGQKQRIAIARAIVSDPKVLLLDEATSALDTQSEGVVQDALDKAAAGRTTITIAHRLSTIKDADVIYVLGDGRVLEYGSHNELLEKGGAYTRLVMAQKLREGISHSQDLEEEPSGPLESTNARSPNEKGVEPDGILLERRNTTRSLASEALEKQRLQINKEREDVSFPYLFKRMGLLIRDQWRNYFYGTILAIRMVYPAYGVVFALGIEGFSAGDAAEKRRDGDRNALWFFIIAVVSMISVSGTTYLFSASASALTTRLRSLSFKAILRQDVEYFDRDENSTGNLTVKLADNPQKVYGLAGITLSTIIQAISTIIVGLIVGLSISWQISLLGFACMPLVISPGYIRLRVVVMKDQINKKAHEESSQIACEAASSIRTVAALTREDDFVRLYAKSLEIPLKKSNRSAIWSQGLYALSQSTSVFVIALSFWYGARLVSNLKASVFEFFVGLMSVTFSVMDAGNMFSYVPDMSSAKGAGSDIIRLLDSIPDIDAESEKGKTPDPAQVKGYIRFENVHFRYPTRPGVRVLRDFSFEIRPGTYVALVGASGCGKSTIIQLLERFYDTLAGDIYLDGENITEFNVQEYRKQLALVSQEPTLYSGTIRFNILLGAVTPESEVTQADIEAVCRDANILDFIQSLPQGFDTEVGGKGAQLSGGQKQRIAIARALLRNPKVLLLDEATSALDSNSERAVQEALDQASKGRTTIAIAHRLSTIQNADCIYFIKAGRVSEYGTHDQLLAKRGDYYEYVQLQALSREG